MSGTFKLCKDGTIIFRDESGNSASGKDGIYTIWRKGGEISGRTSNMHDMIRHLNLLQEVS